MTYSSAVDSHCFTLLLLLLLSISSSFTTSQYRYQLASLRVRSAMFSQHLPERSILSCISCVCQLHVKRWEIIRNTANPGWDQETTYKMGAGPPRAMGNFGGCLAYWKPLLEVLRIHVEQGSPGGPLQFSGGCSKMIRLALAGVSIQATCPERETAGLDNRRK